MEVSALPNPSGIAGLKGPSALLRLQSDERLITMTRRGNHAAFEVLCARYQSRLLSFCRHMLNSKEDAEDVLQEVFAAAFNAVLADDRPINVRPWLYRIARNRSLNHLRRNTATGVDSMDIHFAENGLSTSDKVIRRESFRELIADVHELPETQRTALLLREIDAMSYEQIADAMETTVPSVKSLLVRARISLAEAAEARKMSCDEVRLELGEAAEGINKVSTPARRHVRGCERCSFFKKQLKQNNHALAAIMPVAPLLMLKKLILAKLGITASAGGAHMGAGAGAAAGAGAGAGAGAAAGAGAGAAAGGGGFGILTAGAGALATKAVAGLAVAAIVSAGAVAADHAVTPSHHHGAPVATASAASHAAVTASPEIVVSKVRSQPVSTGAPAVTARRRHPHPKVPLKTAVSAAPAISAPSTPATTETTPTDTTTTATTPPATTTTPVQVTEVTTETTALPTTATSGEAAPTPPVTASPPPAVTTPETPAVTTPTTSTPPIVETRRVSKSPSGTTGGTLGPKLRRAERRAARAAAGY
jgi:RNA polymerase sigma factor (sigma-70 family)